MKIKVGDQVKVIAGKEKGKEGKIIKTLKKENKVVVEGLNKIKKHLKPRYTGQNGSIEEVEAPIHVSKVKKIKETQKAKKAKTTSKKSEKKAS